MVNFLHNRTWSNSEWDVFINNLEVLRLSKKLSKSELNSTIGVSNAYRRDRKRASYETISKICKKFAVTEDWLSESHIDVEDKLTEIKENNKKYINRGGCKPHTIEELFGDQMSNAVIMLMKVYRSDNKNFINIVNSILTELCAAIEGDDREED